MKDESELQIIRQATTNPALQKSSRRGGLFFVGIAISCIGEAMLIGYALFWHDGVSDVGFSVAIALLAGGNMAMLAENKLKNLVIRVSKIQH